MMGTKARSFGLLPSVTLEELVPLDHFYRHLEATLDLSFVRNLVRETYADIGRPSIDPVVFFKLQLVMFFEGLRSERQLMQVVADRLSLRWYLGYDLTEPVPDHSSLSRIRERYGLEAFRRFFETVVERCVAAGLVWGKELYIDATKVEANAATDSLQPRFAVEAHLARLFATEGDEGDDGSESGGPTGGGPRSAPERLPVALSQEAGVSLAEHAAFGHDWIGLAGRPDRATTRGAYRRTADFRVSTTDPDATPMPPGEGRTRLGYQDHYVVDGGKVRIILMALVTPAEVQENQPALDLLWRARFRWKLRPRQVTGDTKYGTTDNIAAIERERIRAYMPLSAVGQRAGMFGEQDFAYDAAADIYRCPGGQALRFSVPLSEHAAAHLRRTGRSVCRMRPPPAMHYGEAGSAHQPPSRRGVPGSGARLPPHRVLRKGDAETPGLGRTAVRRGQGLARAAAVPLAGSGERQWGGTADCRRAEPQALAELAGLGAAPVPERSCGHRPAGAVTSAWSGAVTALDHPDQFG
jgi:transposase